MGMKGAKCNWTEGIIDRETFGIMFSTNIPARQNIPTVRFESLIKSNTYRLHFPLKLVTLLMIKKYTLNSYILRNSQKLLVAHIRFCWIWTIY